MKTETHLLNITQQTLTQEKKCRVYKKITTEKKKKNITISQEAKLGKSQGRNRKDKQIINIYLNKQHHWNKRADQCRGGIN